MHSYLKRCINMEGIDHIRIATGYWDVPGMALVADELRAFLERGDTWLQILIGKEPNVKGYYLKDPTQKFPDDYIKTDLLQLHIKEEYKAVVDLLLTHCKHTERNEDGEEIEVGTGQIAVHKYTEDKVGKEVFLHSKCYIFIGKIDSYGIIGSSNFTQKGLTENAELNYLETNGMIITAEPKEGSPSKGHRIWFDEKWGQSTPWTNEFVNEIIKPSRIGREVNRERKQRQKAEAEEALTKPFTPYELYIKLLQTLFGSDLDKTLDPQIKSYLPEAYRAFDYQIDAVKQCYRKMKEHGGFLLADVVGLGKTVVGALLVRHFLTEPQKEGRGARVLIVTPPAVLQPWRATLGDICAADPELNDRIDYISLGRIDKWVDSGEEVTGDEETLDNGTLDGVLDQSKTYGLILIDESHRFRNSDTEMYRALNGLIGSITPAPYVGLLSATPQNNSPKDLQNQIYLFQRAHQNSSLTTVPGGNLDVFFKEANQTYRELIKGDSSLTTEERQNRLELLSQKIRTQVLEPIMVRRTRTDVKKYFQKDIEAQGLVFPHIVGPMTLRYDMNEAQDALFCYTMDCIAPIGDEDATSLTYARYRAIEYFANEKDKQKHKGRGSRTAGDVAGQLAWLMQQSLVKRLESSASAFRESLRNLWQNTQNMIRMWENDTLFVCPDIDVNGELRAHSSFELAATALRQKIDKLNKQGRNEGGKNAEYRREHFDRKYYDMLQQDAKILHRLCTRWDEIKNDPDPKLEAFKQRLFDLFDPKKNTSHRLVIFTEAIVTAEELGHVVKEAGYRPLVIRSQNRDEMRDVIRRNFDANCPTGEQRNDYDVLISTDTLAEGVNLHRAHVILNYDTPWNATRLMQRIGRVNRIGSEAPNIYVYNFMPSEQGDREIGLVRQAYVKLQSFHTLFGEDNKIFTDRERVVHYELSQHFEKEEEAGDNIRLKYVKELREYRDRHHKCYERIATANAPGDWLMVQTADDTRPTYFLVETCPDDAMIVRLDPQGKAAVEWPQRILEELRADEATHAVDRPVDWEEMKKKAVLAYRQHFVNTDKLPPNKKLKQAVAIIAQLAERSDLSERAEDLLAEAREKINEGNVDVVQKVIELDQKQDWSQLFLDDTIECALGFLAAESKTIYDNARVILATIK